jgi:transmembrane sensor
MLSHRDIEDRAAAWLAERDRGDWSEERQGELVQWLEISTENRVAFLRLEAAWDETRRLKALGAGLPAGSPSTLRKWRDTPFFVDREMARAPLRAPLQHAGAPSWRRIRPRYGAAAIMILAMMVGGYLLLRPPGDHYSASVGKVVSVPLKDGSSIILNAGSKVRVNLTPQERRVDLERGEAFFVVAKDPRRPFVVQAGDKQVIAVGTQFSVRRDGDEVRVIVTEGTVQLKLVGNHLHVSGEVAPSASGLTPESPRLTAGTVARSADGDVLVQEKSIREAEIALTWRVGYLTFHETTLADAVAEFNRYNTHRITIEDPRVGEIRISGTFRPTNYEAFVRLLQDGFAIRVKSVDGETRLAIK